MKVRWSTPARQDIASIVRYIRKDSPKAAGRVRLALTSECASLAKNPRRGRVIDSYGTFELVFHPLPYIAVYKIAGNEIHILRVRHGAQQWPELT